MMKRNRRAKLIGAVSVMVLAGSIAGAAAAQSAKPAEVDVEEVVVTGTSIRGVAAVGSPAVNLSQEDIKAAGVSNVAAVVRTLPAVFNIGPDESRTGGGQDAAANSTRISAINLRGLGPEATLVLVNGRRMAPGGILRALSDPSTISTLAAERLEVVLDGASAVYGADAVAGVVNIITRKNVDGWESSVRYGVGDGIDEKSFNQSFGKTWTGGDVFAALEYNDRSDLERKDRAFLSNDLRPYGGTDQRSTQALAPNLVVAGVRRPLPTLAGDANRYDAGQFGDFLPRQLRINGFLSARQNLTDDIQVWYEGFASRRRIQTDNAQLGGTATVPSTNPFYLRGVSGVPVNGAESVEFRLHRAGAQSEGKELAVQNAVGLKWQLPADWQLNAYVTRSTDTAVSGINGEQINNFGLAAALADTNPATSLNIFSPGTITPAQYAKIVAFRLQKTDALDMHYEAKVDGPLFSLPAGQVRAAFGVAYHDSSFRYQEYQNALSVTNTPSTTNDRTTYRDVKTVFGELFVPLVSSANAMPFVRRLDLSVATRYDDYSDFGNTTNPKVSLVWEPVEGLALRGTWGKSFRAPSLTDIGNLNFLFFSNVPDPANGNALIGQLLYTGSNPALVPEKAETYSVGFDWNPTLIPGLSISTTYYKVDYKDRILGTGASLANEALFRQLVIRNPPLAQIQALLASGFLVTTPPTNATDIKVLVDGRRNNVGTLIQNGLDISVRYRLTTDHGIFTAGLDHAEIFHVKRNTFPGQPLVESVNLFEQPLASRGRASLNWRDGAWGANLFFNYGSSYIDSAIVPNVTAKVMQTVDAGLSYQFQEGSMLTNGLRISVNAQNLFDEQPPVVLNTTNAWDNTTASGTGRFVSIEVSKKW